MAKNGDSDLATSGDFFGYRAVLGQPPQTWRTRLPPTALESCLFAVLLDLPFPPDGNVPIRMGSRNAPLRIECSHAVVAATANVSYIATCSDYDGHRLSLC